MGDQSNPWGGYHLRRETGPAAATTGCVGVIEYESSTHDLVSEIDLSAIQVEQALRIADDRDSMLLELLVGVLFALSQVKEITESRAASATNSHAKISACIKLLLFRDFAYFFCGAFRENHTLAQGLFRIRDRLCL